jgi:ABC-type antimicrobial peptide transport system permease subunit
VAQRTQKIGIRMALGADRSTVLRMILREGLQLAGIGIGLGLGAGLLLSRTMGSLLYGVRSDDPMTYATLSTALLAVALLSV